MTAPNTILAVLRAIDPEDIACMDYHPGTGTTIRLASCPAAGVFVPGLPPMEVLDGIRAERGRD